MNGYLLLSIILKAFLIKIDENLLTIKKYCFFLIYYRYRIINIYLFYNKIKMVHINF